MVSDKENEEAKELESDGRPRVRASENTAKRFKFQNKVKYRKPSNLRRKLKKRYQKYRVFAMLSVIAVIIIVFLFSAVKFAIEKSDENLEQQKQKRIRKIIEQEERNKKF
ncbi:MAG: hypothetical protein K1X82_00725 [Bacteroidia bacterium]|nr:hypothetical protein [Bacteroidia bacterium]